MNTLRKLIHTSTLLLLLLFNLFTITANAQRELWGTGESSTSAIWTGYEEYANQNGWIYKTDKIGENIQIVYHFDSIVGNGKNPISELLLASNGKLYGITNRGGSSEFSGLIYEYDLALDSFRVVKNFTVGNPQEFITNPMGSNTRLIEIQPGLIIGGFNNGIFAYNFVIDTLYNFSPAPASKNFNNIFKASDGNLYAALSGYSDCLSGVQSSNPSYERINPLTGALTTLFLNPCLAGIISSNFIEKNGILYSPVSAFGHLGIISSFNTGTNNYQELYNFQGGLLGERPTPTMLEANNGLFYGTTTKGGANGSGILFELNPATNQFDRKHDFQNNFGNSLSLRQSENGKLYGTTTNGVFEYDVNSQVFRTTSSVPSFKSNALIEICRKPFYKYSDTTSFNLCEGTPFEINLKCNNSEAVIWRKNGTIIPEFNSSLLNFDSITVSQSGTWQVEFINECGSTFGPNITLNITPSFINTIMSTISPDSLVEICPLSSIVLSGNNGGVWNTGETTESITVSNPGVYQIINSNVCGLFYSNIVTVDTLFIPRPVVSANTSSMLCLYNNIVISSTIAGNWNTGDSALSITVSAEPNVPYYMWSQNECRTDTSNIINLNPLFFYPYEPEPELTNTLNYFTICSGDSVQLTSNINSNFNNNYSYNWIRFDGTYNYPASGSVPSSNNVPFIYAKQQGAYFLRQQTPCGNYKYTDTIYVSVNQTLTPSVIQPIYPLANLCEGNTIQLKTLTTGGVWNTGSTSDTLNVQQDGSYYYVVTNACGAVNSNTLTYNFMENNVSFTLPTPSICVAGGDTSIVLSGGFPSGGYYSGAGVSGNVFNTALVNSGANTLTYTKTTSSCTFTATATIFLDTVTPEIPPIYYIVIGSGIAVTVQPGEEVTLCDNQGLILSTDPWSSGSWSTGEVALHIFISSAPANYYFTNTNGCGGTNSETLIVSTATSISPTFASVGPFCLGTNYTLPTTSNEGIVGTWSPAINNQATTLYTFTPTAGQCANTTNLTVTIHNPVVVSFDLSTSEVCVNDNSILLDNVTPIGGSFTGDGITGNLFDPSMAGLGTHLITYTITDGFGCTSSAVVSISVADLPATPIISLTTADFCENDNSLIFDNVTPNGGVFSGDGIIGNQFDPSIAGTGTHLITYTTSNIVGCSSSATILVSVFNLPDASVILQAATLTAVSGNTYQWLDCDNGQASINGANQVSFSPVQNGNYAVMVTSPEGCTDTSICININSVGINEIWDTELVEVFPNPAKNELNIKSALDIKSIRILDLQGKELLVTTGDKITISTLTAGVYLIEITTSNGVGTKKFIKE